MTFYAVKKSSISGLGIFSSQDLPSDFELGIMMNPVRNWENIIDIEDPNKYYRGKFFERHNIYFRRFTLERFLNHNDDPNCECYVINDSIFCKTIKGVIKDQELTVNYYDARPIIWSLEEKLC